MPTDQTDELSHELVQLGLRGGLSAVGIALAEPFEDTRADLVERKRRGLHGGMQFTYRNPDRSTDPQRILPGARSLVVGAWSYREGERGDGWVPSSSRPVGRVARYARRDHYAALREALGPIANHLKERGWRATVVCDDNALVDRAAAHRAGLGWFGKNSLVLLPGLGSWFVLGSVVTDAPLQGAPPPVPAPHGEGCGSCSQCLQACPTGALVAPGVLDARRCLAWLVQAPGSFPEEHREALGDRIYGCDECQQVCPVNRLADRRDPPLPAPPDSEPAVDLLDLLRASDEELLAAHGRWYIPGRDPRYLRRNALVALGNVGDGRDPETEQVLGHWLGADDPLVVEHARWAALRLGRGDLVVP
ncbi:MAG TPA: tRNA epoxyqueuosine(34) reductase QueG [Acidimicrobiales bacterium]